MDLCGVLCGFDDSLFDCCAARVGCVGVGVVVVRLVHSSLRFSRTVEQSK